MREIQLCPDCQTESPPTAAFCAACGHQFAQGEEGDRRRQDLDDVRQLERVLAPLLAVVLVVVCGCIGAYLLVPGLFAGRSYAPLARPAGTVNTGYTVRYEVTGTARYVSITLENDSGGTEQLDKTSVPWSRTYYGFRRGDFVYLSAQNQGDSGSVVATIYVNGSQWKQSESTGAYVIATASGSVGE